MGAEVTGLLGVEVGEVGWLMVVGYSADVIRRTSVLWVNVRYSRE